MASALRTTESLQPPHAGIAHQISVCDLVRDHVHTFAELPGELSNFEARGPGYQWNCEFQLSGPDEVQDDARERGPLRLHFCLIDTERRTRPVAALLLEEGYSGETHQSRFLHLQDLAQALDDINEDLAQRNEVIEAAAKANRFIEALAGVKEELGDDVIWE
jgi:hypothetical protein